ncbi:MAG: SusD/RagB family nutrient-binding outer membrane lipoprotein [Bacteroidota bacterium]|nr:SusD/RagB family nutrient-binding outer membrane lipoprotein [Bacteroidota bacterium]
MKRILIKFSMIILVLSAMTSCQKWLYFEYDPNDITDSPAINEGVYLIGVESEWAQQAVTFFVWWNGMKDWLLWYASDGTQGYETRFEISTDYGGEIWGAYSGALMHSNALYEKAKENGNKRFQGIGAVITAWHWFNMADYYDQAPLDEALKGAEFPYPQVNTLEEIYAHANALLDEAIECFAASDPGDLVPTAAQDYIFGADFTKWTRLCYSLKARYAMRLTYLPGKTATGQADLALQYLQNGMQANTDMCAWRHQASLQFDSYIYEESLYDYSAAGMTPSVYIVNLLNGLNDPRRMKFWTLAEAGGYIGHRSGTSSVAGNRPSRWAMTYCTQTYPDMIMMYSENLFLQAEANALKGQYGPAETAMKAGIRADMEYHGVAEADIVAYLAKPELTMPTNIEAAQELILTQKYIANTFETTESYFDFIRTGYPKLDFTTINQVINTNTFPRRNPYPPDEIEKNPSVAALGQPDYFRKGTAWDTKPFSWRSGTK